MTNVEDRLSHALRSTADAAVYDATPLSAITGEADRIRRVRRRRGVLATAAAVAVIAIPSAVFLRPDAAPTLERPTAPATSSPSVAPTPQPTPTPPPRMSFDVEDMPLGPPPRLGYVVNGEYVAPDGTRQPAPPDGGPLGQFAQVGDGFLYTETTYGMSNEGEPTAVATYRRTPGREAEYLGCSDGLHSGSGGVVAYLTTPCPGSGDGSAPALSVVDPTGATTTRPVPETSGYPELTLMRGDDAIVRDSATRQLWAVPPTGDPQQIAALTEWKLKDSEIVSFSPDGRSVLLQGISWPGNTIADAATGEILGSVPLTNFSGLPGLYGLTWEDDEHLVGIYESALLRVDLTGALEVAAKDLPQAVRLENDKPF
jgi:hypothetical protein